MADATVSLDSAVKHFETLPDPRDTRNRRHLLVDVIVISVCGVIVGCEGPTAIASEHGIALGQTICAIRAWSFGH